MLIRCSLHPFSSPFTFTITFTLINISNYIKLRSHHLFVALTLSLLFHHASASSSSASASSSSNSLSSSSSSSFSPGSQELSPSAQLAQSSSSSFLFLRSLFAKTTPSMMVSVAHSLAASFPSIQIMTGSSGTSVSVALQNSTDRRRSTNEDIPLQNGTKSFEPSTSQSSSVNEIVSDYLPNWARWSNGTSTTTSSSSKNDEKLGTLPLYSQDIPTQNISTYSSIWNHHNPNGTLDPEDESKPFEVLITNEKTMAYLKFDHHGRDLVKCSLHDIEKDATATSRMSGQPGLSNFGKPLQANFPTLMEAIRRCTRLTRKQLGLAIPTVNSTNSGSSSSSSSPFSNTENSTLVHDGTSNSSSNSASSKFPWTDGAQNFVSLWKGILPGTKWCGTGDTANNWDDLGPKVDVDICCRAHDHCPIRLKAFRMEYGLINFSFYTKSHCDCDAEFYRCLKKSPNHYGTMLGNFYFNVLKVQCIQYQKQPVCIKKRKNDKTGIEECIQYEVSNEDSKMKMIPFEYTFA